VIVDLAERLLARGETFRLIQETETKNGRKTA
jgi:hypothetical protein